MKASLFNISCYLIFFSTSLNSCAQDSTNAPVATVRDLRFVLGSTELKVRKTTYATTYSFQFIQLHSNEATADQVTQAISQQLGIDYLQIQNGSDRTIAFQAGSKRYHFDPNRIFSTAGIVESLKFHSRYTETAFRAVQQFRDSLLKHLDTVKTIIAVHNNSNGDFSLAHYRESGKALVYQNPDQDEDDFFLTTDNLLFNELKERNFNVVLEDSTSTKDDGSLSVYCSKRRLSYVNVEAEHGHTEAQNRMLKILLGILTNKKP